MEAMELLRKVYPPQGIFINNPHFAQARPELHITCCVPQDQQYTLVEIPYVSAENYVRILSQACYILAYNSIRCGHVKIERVSESDFVHAMLRMELYYRNLAMTFHQRTLKGENFKMTLKLVDYKEIHRFGDFVLFSFVSDKTVISGEMSFVYVKPP